MRLALKEAKRAFSQEEVPVGAILVVKEKVVARGCNQVELLQDATAHAEMLCLCSASGVLQNWRYETATLYSTLEPCAMCAGAMFSCRIKRLVWGAPDLRLGANGSFFDFFSLKHPMWKMEVTKGILKEESALLMKEFFLRRRKEKPYSSKSF